jgi:hypothetical protein
VLIEFLLPVKLQNCTGQKALPQDFVRAAPHMANLFPAQDFDSAMVEVCTLIADDSISLIRPNSFVVLLHGEPFRFSKERNDAIRSHSNN